jgi:hypothetical protein
MSPDELDCSVAVALFNRSARLEPALAELASGEGCNSSAKAIFASTRIPALGGSYSTAQ